MSSYSEVRMVFAENLRDLIHSRQASVSMIANETGLPRQQLSRYLAGTVLPNMECLEKISDFFSVDARILFTPLESLYSQNEDVQNGMHFTAAFGVSDQKMAADRIDVADGFYRVWKPAYAFRDTLNVSLSLVSTQGKRKIVKGIDPKAFSPFALDGDLSISKREHIGVFCEYSGRTVVFCKMPRRDFLTCTILRPEFGWRLRDGSLYGVCVTSAFDPTFVNDGAVGIIYERLPQNHGQILKAARECGALAMENAPLVIQELLKTGIQ